ncbi:LysR family transcriptional regulator [Streptomyces sp. NPDC048584]|uniref:LysR family transcriptional regulator n=1 Tax=Streptomyces sp. NPDC048584 TaxID=3365573 RepID=UPI0037150102
MLLRQLEYLVALARERHFARAADSCYVSQPTLSEGLRKLETELGVSLVRRDRRFEGLTPEGERIVVWAQRILADRDALQDEAVAIRSGLSGQLRVGAVPTAVTAVSLLTQPFCAQHPLTTVQVQTDLRSSEVLEKLQSYEIDAGITYFSEEMDRRFEFVPLYREKYVLLTPHTLGAARLSQATWEEAARQPLCLLVPVMQGRRVLDSVFGEIGASVRPRVETDSIASLFAHVKTGRWASIVPHTWLHVFGVPTGMRAVPLVQPVRTARMGLVAAKRDVASVMARAFIEVAERSDMAATLERLPDQTP